MEITIKDLQGKSMTFETLHIVTQTGDGGAAVFACQEWLLIKGSGDWFNTGTSKEISENAIIKAVNKYKINDFAQAAAFNAGARWAEKHLSNNQ